MVRLESTMTEAATMRARPIISADAVALVRFVPIPGTTRTASRTSSRPLLPTTSLPTSGPVWDDAVAAHAWEGPPVWVHGDLHPANVVVSDGTLSGIVDFGDLFACDPAWDLAAASVLLPAGTASRCSWGRREIGASPAVSPNWGPAGRAALDHVLKGA